MRTYRRIWDLRCRRLQAAVTIACLACVTPSARASAQGAAAGVLSGVVVDSGAGMGIFGVEIAIDGSSLRATTDERGEFRFPNGSGGPRTLHLRRLGFRPATVAVSAGESTAPITVRLAPSTQYLASVQVRAERTKYTGRLAGYYERLERRTHGQFITRAELERDRPAQLTDMLQRTPGIRITRGKPGAQSIRMRGRDCRPLVWVDGAAMSAGDVDLDSFSPESLEGIEMYMGASGAPARYQAARGQSGCGTILLWSRGPDTEARSVGPGVAPGELESLITSLAVYASEEVDVAATLDPAAAWAVPYPPSMRASGASGAVIAEFVVDTLGRIEGENFGIVSSTHPLFSAAVREAARTTVFRPASRRGRSVRQLVRQPFVFHPLRERP